MDGFMKSILSRVLSEEIGKQKHWAELEQKEFGTDTRDRDDNISRIKQFMAENDIEFRPDYM